MTKTGGYRETLRALDEWEPFLLAESGLPGPRANLELVQAVAEEAGEAMLVRLVDSQDEFLVMCGAVGLGRQVALARRSHLERLRRLASDPRWRGRKAVAMALQRWGDDDFDVMATEAERLGGRFSARTARRGPDNLNAVIRLNYPGQSLLRRIRKPGSFRAGYPGDLRRSSSLVG